jgi:hypothetical protein
MFCSKREIDGLLAGEHNTPPGRVCQLLPAVKVVQLHTTIS